METSWWDETTDWSQHQGWIALMTTLLHTELVQYLGNSKEARFFAYLSHRHEPLDREMKAERWTPG